jgi:tripartite-type tricarboxylate transporter receptor subunit TctC
MGAPHSLPKLILAMIAASIAALSPARADEYPVRPITLVVGFAVGGPNDTIARILAERMQLSLGQPVIVENVAGAAGSLGAGRVAHAPPDGYTLSLGFIGTHVINAAIYKLPYDPLNDFEPISVVATNPQLIVSRKDIPAKNLTELIAWLKAHPDHAAQGTGGVGSPSHVAGALFQQLTGTTFAFVPYRGAAPALQDLIAGHVDLMFDTPTTSLPLHRDGKVKIVAVGTTERVRELPEVPTIAEAALPGYRAVTWYAMVAPPQTPAALADKINRDVTEILARADVIEKVRGIQMEPIAKTRAEAAQFFAEETALWGKVIKAANIPLQ